MFGRPRSGGRDVRKLPTSPRQTADHDGVSTESSEPSDVPLRPFDRARHPRQVSQRIRSSWRAPGRCTPKETFVVALENTAASAQTHPTDQPTAPSGCPDARSCGGERSVAPGRPSPPPASRCGRTSPGRGCCPPTARSPPPPRRWRTLFYLEVFPTSPLILSPFTDALTGAEGAAPGAGRRVRPGPSRPGPGIGQQNSLGNERHQKWRADVGSPTRSSTRSTAGAARTRSPPRRCCRSTRRAGRPSSFDATGKHLRRRHQAVRCRRAPSTASTGRSPAR